MKILIICLTYSEGFSYMENQLAKAFLRLGCEVKLIASTESYVEQNIHYFAPGDYSDTDGYQVTRLAFSWGGILLSRKLWKVQGLKDEIEKYQPNIIYHMGICGLETKTSTNYIKHHKNVSLYYDNHAAFYNSGKNWISRNIRYSLLLGKIIKDATKVAKKVFYIGEGEKSFLNILFTIPSVKLEYFPLGDFILKESEYQTNRNRVRESLLYNSNDIVVFHTGKLSIEKKTFDIIQSLLAIKNDSLKLCIVGGLSPETEKRVLPLIESNPERIKYLGWKDSQELSTLLCGGDIYVQFSVSSTFLTAMCRRCVGISVNPNNTYKYIPTDTYFEVFDKNDLEETFHKIANHVYDLEKMKQKSYSFAQKDLDYTNLVKSRIIDPHQNQIPLGDDR